MNENIQIQELLLVDMPIQLMATIVIYYSHSNLKTFMFLELKEIKFLMFSFLGYLSGMFLRNFHYRIHGQLGQKHYLRTGISRKKTSDNVYIGCGSPQII